MKSIQKEIFHLKNRFNGSVNDLVLEFGKNIKHELDQRPTSKQIETTVENLKIRIRLLEQGKGGKSKNRRRNRNGDGGDSTSSELKDSTSMLRFDDHGSENNDNESDENEDDNDEEDDNTTNETTKRKL